MKTIIFGIFLILHGLVYFLYMGQSLRKFELHPGMVWPDGSWAFSKLISKTSIRIIAATICIISATSFIIGGADLILSEVIWKYPTTVAATLATLMHMLLWDGKMKRLMDKGILGVIINISILGYICFSN